MHVARGIRRHHAPQPVVYWRRPRPAPFRGARKHDTFHAIEEETALDVDWCRRVVKSASATTTAGADSLGTASMPWVGAACIDGLRVASRLLSMARGRGSVRGALHALLVR